MIRSCASSSTLSPPARHRKRRQGRQRSRGAAKGRERERERERERRSYGRREEGQACGQLWLALSSGGTVGAAGLVARLRLAHVLLYEGRRAREGGRRRDRGAFVGPHGQQRVELGPRAHCRIGGRGTAQDVSPWAQWAESTRALEKAPPTVRPPLVLYKTLPQSRAVPFGWRPAESRRNLAKALQKPRAPPLVRARPWRRTRRGQDVNDAAEERGQLLGVGGWRRRRRVATAVVALLGRRGGALVGGRRDGVVVLEQAAQVGAHGGGGHGGDAAAAHMTGRAR
eukprot:4895991-Prymnesium_polylepis.1